MANPTTLTPKSSSAVTASSRASTRLTGLIAASFMVSGGAGPHPCPIEEHRRLRLSRRERESRFSFLLAGRNEPLVGELEELAAVDLHAPHFLVVRTVVGQRPEKRVRLVLGQDPMQ